MTRRLILTLGAVVIVLSGADLLLLAYGLVDAKIIETQTSVRAWHTIIIPFVGFLIGFAVVTYSERLFP